MFESEIKIRILCLEDNEADAFLIEREINKILLNPDIRIVSEFDQFKSTIENYTPDIILCDYQLYGFTGLDVLQYLKKSKPSHQDIPLIFVTGTVNDEELAANTILEGAIGFILKKDISVLHEKLLPHFKNVIDSKKDVTDIAFDHIKEQKKYEDHIERLKSENKKIQITNKFMKKELERIKLEMKSSKY